MSRCRPSELVSPSSAWCQAVYQAVLSPCRNFVSYCWRTSAILQFVSGSPARSVGAPLILGISSSRVSPCIACFCSMPSDTGIGLCAPDRQVVIPIHYKKSSLATYACIRRVSSEGGPELLSVCTVVKVNKNVVRRCRRVNVDGQGQLLALGNPSASLRTWTSTSTRPTITTSGIGQ